MHTGLQLALALRRHGAPLSKISTLLQVHGALKGCRSVLDIGCGPDSALSLFGFEHLAGYEGYQPSLEEAARRGTHQELVQGRVQDLGSKFTAGQYDCCVALDVIEHLPKAEGLEMLAAMERISRHKCVLTTPNGFLPQGHTEGGDLQEHLSGWEPEEMRQHGYSVSGLLGPKALRGEYHKLRRGPDWFWGPVSLVGQLLVTRWFPAKAAALLCVKVIEVD